MTIKVNKYVMFFNKIHPHKKFVNSHITRLKSYNADVPIYQKTLKNGSTALSVSIPDYKGGKLDEFIIVNKDGTYIEKNTQKISNKLNFLCDKITRFCEKDGWIQSSFMQSKFFHNKKLEEVAKREITKDNKVNIWVRSVAGRKSEFPQTKIAGKLHPAVMSKSIDQNGDTIYRENYLTR